MKWVTQMSQLPDHYQDVGPGWKQLLTSLHEELAATFPQYGVAQVKEKFAGLRVSLEYIPDTMYVTALGLDSIIRRYESMSLTVCEYCGQSGSLDETHHWVKVRCEDCKKNNRR